MFARHFIDSLDFARHGRELHGVVPVAEMPRLQDVLVEPVGEIAYVLRGLQGRDGNLVLELELNGLLQLVCQRCLQRLTYPVELLSRLILIADSELDESVDDGSEIDSIPADKHLDVFALFEEEVLLHLPFAPKHPVNGCRAAVEGRIVGDAKVDKYPFAVLAELKKNSS